MRRWNLRSTITATIVAAASVLCPQTPANAADDSSHVSFTTGIVRETFIPTADGGIEDAVVLRRSSAAVKHLQAETRKRARAFAHGQFVDPTNPHGDLVPGLREMRGQWNRVHVRYEDLPAGSRIKYTTSDPVMVEALHQWFVARAIKRVR
jgi:hypothetical protein